MLASGGGASVRVVLPAAAREARDSKGAQPPLGGPQFSTLEGWRMVKWSAGSGAHRAGSLVKTLRTR